MLGMANFVPEQVDSKSEVTLEKDGDGFSSTSVHLIVTAKIAGIDHDTFQSIASKARAWCPVSKLMNAEIGFEATLVTSCSGRLWWRGKHETGIHPHLRIAASIGQARAIRS
jgi:hypothetical protein